MNEADTRKQLVDQRLALAGWHVADLGQVVQEFAIDLRACGGQGQEFADYVLLLHGQVVAVVEAKKTSVDAHLGREQALQYAQHIQAQEPARRGWRSRRSTCPAEPSGSYQFRPNRIENTGNLSGPNRGPRLTLASCRTGQKSRTGANQVGCVSNASCSWSTASR